MKEEIIKLDDHQRWQGKYKGINFQIAKWKPIFTPETEKYDNGYIWNYYIFIRPREKIISKYSEERIDYYEMYKDVEMHGGITYWARHYGSEMKECDEIGCDYAHSWDYDDSSNHKLIERDVNEIMRDVKNTIDTLPEDLFFAK